MTTNQKHSPVLITAHRGASAMAPENTMAAMLAAIQAQADYAELDVQETKDGHVILLHDDNLQRTTTGTGFIWEKTLADLNGIDAGGWKASEFAGEPIPLLSAVIEQVRGKLKLNIEIKINGHQQQIEPRVVKIIEEFDFVEHCIVTSFDSAAIDKVKKLNPRIKVGLIFEEMPCCDLFHNQWEILSIQYRLINNDFIQNAHQVGKEIHVWTVDPPELMQQLIEAGVDNIITNQPHLLRQILRRHSAG